MGHANLCANSLGMDLAPCLVASYLGFVVGTIVKSSRQQVGIWKTSAFAMLLHELAGGARHKLDPEASASEVEAAARKIRVTLSPDKDTFRLVLV